MKRSDRHGVGIGTGTRTVVDPASPANPVRYPRTIPEEGSVTEIRTRAAPTIGPRFARSVIVLRNASAEREPAATGAAEITSRYGPALTTLFSGPDAQAPGAVTAASASVTQTTESTRRDPTKRRTEIPAPSWKSRATFFSSNPSAGRSSASPAPASIGSRRWCARTGCAHATPDRATTRSRADVVTVGCS